MAEIGANIHSKLDSLDAIRPVYNDTMHGDTYLAEIDSESSIGPIAHDITPFSIQEKSSMEKFLEIKERSIPVEEKACLLCDILKNIGDDFSSSRGLASKIISYLEDILSESPIDKVLRIRGEIVKAIKFQESDPLYDLTAETQTITDSQAHSEIGAFFHGLGGTALSGSSLRVVKREKREGDIHQIDFKLSHQARLRVGKFIEDLQNMQGDAGVIDALKDIGVDISISNSKYNYESKGEDGFFDSGLEMGDSIEIIFNGIGKVIIGDKKESLGYLKRYVVTGNRKHPDVLRRRVTIQLEGNLDKGRGLQHLHMISSLLGLGPIVLKADADILEKRKVAMLFRTFFPKEASAMEENPGWLTMNSEAMKNAIIEYVPEMRIKFDLYYDKIEPVEVFKGHSELSLPDMPSLAYKAGARLLMRGEKRCNIGRVVDMLLRGTLSSQGRFDSGLIQKGESSKRDHSCGGGDHVFTRIITKKLMEWNSNEFEYSGVFQIIYSLDVLSRSGTTYSYPDDRYGSKRGALYSERMNMEAQIRAIEECESDENETMINYAIPPQYIKGVLVQTPGEKNKLIGLLEESGQVVLKDGIKYIRGIPVDDFIHLGSKFTESMVPRPPEVI